MEKCYDIDYSLLKSLRVVKFNTDDYIYDERDVYKNYESNGYETFLMNITFDGFVIMLTGMVTFLGSTYDLEVLIDFDGNVIYSCEVEDVGLFDIIDFTESIGDVVRDCIPSDIWVMRAMHN